MKFRKSISSDESTNVADGMVKARTLYKKLSLLAHPDKHLNQTEDAERIMSQITANKFNYSELLKIQEEMQRIFH